MKAKMLRNTGPWAPVRSGQFYCSSTCGRGCTYAEYLEVCLKAEALANRMGKDWQPEVWENLGWHAQVVNGSATITIHGGNYELQLNIPGIGPSYRHVDNPVEGFKNMVRDRLELTNNALQMLQKIEPESEDPRKVKLVCTTCGSDDVKADAFASWDMGTQELVLCGVLDGRCCERCGDDCDTHLVPVVN